MRKIGTTLIIGASENPERYSHKAALALLKKGYKIKLLGKSVGEIDGIPILNGFPKIGKIHAVTLYLNPTNQVPYYKYIVKLNPQRVIFNPGTENNEFMEILKSKNILAEEACTLVLLSINAY